MLDAGQTTGVSNSPETTKNFMLNSSASVTQVGMPTPSASQFQIPLIKMKARGVKNNNQTYIMNSVRKTESPSQNRIIVSAIKEVGKRSKIKSKGRKAQPSTEFKRISRVEQINENVIENLQKAINTQDKRNLRLNHTMQIRQNSSGRT